MESRGSGETAFPSGTPSAPCSWAVTGIRPVPNDRRINGRYRWWRGISGFSFPFLFAFPGRACMIGQGMKE